MSTATHPSAAPSTGLSSGWSLALGILLIVAGMAAIVFPVIAAVAATLYVGWFALIAGAIAIVVAIKTHAEPSFGWRVLVGLLYLALGFLLVANPLAGAASLALFVGSLLAVFGVVELVLAFRVRPHRAWGWLLANGIISIVLAVLIAIGWPYDSLVLIGYLVGFQIIFCGVSRLAFAWSSRGAAPAPDEAKAT